MGSGFVLHVLLFLFPTLSFSSSLAVLTLTFSYRVMTSLSTLSRGFHYPCPPYFPFFQLSTLYFSACLLINSIVCFTYPVRWGGSLPHIHSSILSLNKEAAYLFLVPLPMPSPNPPNQTHPSSLANCQLPIANC